MNANSISLRRLKNLIRYEWAIDRRFYVLGTVGVFMISFGVFLTVWFNNIEGFLWRRGDYNTIFFSGFIFVSILLISQSFIDLRDKTTSIRYLTLPASTMEKFIVQVFLRLILPLFIYPIAFSLGTNLSVDVYYFIQHWLLDKTAVPELYKAGIFYLYWNLDANFNVGHWIFFGLIVSIPILMFAGGIIFKKWSFIAMPTFIVCFLIFISGSYYVLVRLIDPNAFAPGSKFYVGIGNPKVFGDVPILILTPAILILGTVVLPFVVSYFKLKESEV